ncbi:MAG: ABC transporter substrate-binding protein [Actinomycetota bacterium]|nr:ABC transporter substrate-binding protein [Actinomycetota bacterium]
MRRHPLWLLAAILMAFSLVAAACGDDDDDDTETTDTTEASEDDGTTTTAAEDEGDEDSGDEGEGEDAEGTGAGDGVLTIGSILPETGDLAFLGPPEFAGAALAEQDINEAGGVLGNDIVFLPGDSGDTTTDIANQTVDRLLAEGADVIVGAASSAVSMTVIDKITGAGVIQFSPANTSPDFTDYEDNGLYFRTAPSDRLQGKVLADLAIEEGATTAAVIYRQESYGTGLANFFQEFYTEAGGTIPDDAFIAYPVDTENFDAEVDAVVAADPDAIIVIGFDESAQILTTMNERGVGPADKAVYGVDGNIGGIGAELSDPSIIAGMRGTEPSVDLSSISDFTARLDEEGAGGIYAYGAETYDAMIISALAAEIAGSDDPTVFAEEINGVTKDGEQCTSFADCKALIEEGTDIDYDGIGGPYEFGDPGEPEAASFRIATYDGGETPNVELDEYRTAEY